MVTLIRRFGRVLSSMVIAACALMTAHSVLALTDQGVIYIQMTSGSSVTKSEARWEIGSVIQAPVQQLTQANPCALVTTPSLLSFSAAAGVASAKQDALGVDFINGSGVNCAGIDSKGNAHEALTITLGPRLRTPNAPKNLRFTKLVLQLELKGTSVVTEIRVNDEFSGAPTEVWTVRGGAAVSGAATPGRAPGDLTSPIRNIDCLEGGVDVAPDARDTCIVSIAAFGNSFTIRSMEGSTSLEGGRSLPGFSEIHLTDAAGIYNCGDTITSAQVTAGGVQVASAACRRLETNLVNCPTSNQCVAVPADIFFDSGGYGLNLQYDAGDQCVAVQCQIAFAPYDIGAAITANSGGAQTGRTTTAIAATVNASGQITDTYPKAGIETTYLQPPVVQFLSTDPKYYLQHCLQELRRHPVVQLKDVSGQFVAGQTITNGSGASAKVISYQVVDGVKKLVYYIASGPQFVKDDMISGSTGYATIATNPTPSSFIRELVGTSTTAGVAGYSVLDYSAKPNQQGIQHACLRALTSELPGFTSTGATGSAATNWVRILIDTYLQGDIRLSVSDR